MIKTGTVYVDNQDIGNENVVIPKKITYRKRTVKETEEKEEIDKLEDLVRGSGEVIYEISSAFPFQLFPDKIIIDKNKVNIVRKDLFFKRVFPIFHKDIMTVKVNRGILFATMEFEIKGYETNPGPVTFLWPYEATRAKQYILGLMDAKKEKVDLTKVSAEKVKKKFREIGEAKDDTETLF